MQPHSFFRNLPPLMQRINFLILKVKGLGDWSNFLIIEEPGQKVKEIYLFFSSFANFKLIIESILN